MNSQTPKVSVIIPAYRCTATIDDAIRSALEQEVHVEIIVINDASPDHLDDVMAKYENNPSIVYVKNDKQMGAAGSRNKGVGLAKAPYVAFLDADDCWRKEKLKTQLAYMHEQDVVLCSTARELMTPDGVPTGHVIPVKSHITYQDLLKHNCIACSSVLIRTEVAREFPMCHEDSHEDYIAWMRILQKYHEAVGINEPFLLYRLSNTGKSGNKLKSAKMTFMAYRYMGFGWFKSMMCFISYAVNGVRKYSSHYSM